MWFWYETHHWYLISLMHCMVMKQTVRKHVPIKAPVKFHESHRRVMRSVNRNR